MNKVVKKMIKTIAITICISLVGCGSTQEIASSPEECKDWRQGVMSINGGVVVIGQTNYEDFIITTGFDDSELIYEDAFRSSYDVSDGYSVIRVSADENGIVNSIFVGVYNDEEDGEGLDLEHTTIVGPGGIVVGTSTLEDMAEYDQRINLRGRFDTEISEYGYYIASMEDETGMFGYNDELYYRVDGDPESRIIYQMSLLIKE